MKKLVHLTAHLLAAVVLAPLFAAPIFAESVALYNGDFGVRYNGRTFDGSTTTFSYTACAIDHTPSLGFSHIVFEVGSCVSESKLVACSPQGCSLQTDPTTNIYGVKWEGELKVGQCQTYIFTLSGEVLEGAAAVTIKAGNCNRDGSCDRKSISGPSCNPPDVTTTTTTSTTSTTTTTLSTTTTTARPEQTSTTTTSSTTITLPAPPSCYTGGPYLKAECAEAPVATPLILDGSASSAGSTFLWSSDCPNALFADATSVRTGFSFSRHDSGGKPTACSVTLTVTQNGRSSSCSTTVAVDRCIFDCAGKLGGAAAYDRCGVCNGNGLSCVGCSDLDISNLLIALDGNAHRQAQLAIQMAKRVINSKKSLPSAKAGAQAVIRIATDLYLENWSLAWSLPSIASKCSNTDLCVSVDNSGILEQYKANAAKLQGALTVSTRHYLRLRGAKASYAARTLRQGEKAYRKSLVILREVPASVSACLAN